MNKNRCGEAARLRTDGSAGGYPNRNPKLPYAAEDYPCLVGYNDVFKSRLGSV